MAHPDLDALLNAVLPFAKQSLEKRGGFFPFAAKMNSSGKVALVGADPGGTQTPSGVLELLQAGLKESAARGELRAVAVCVDATVQVPGGEKSDAVRVKVERQGESLFVFVPYARRFLLGIKYGDLFASPAPAEYFGA